MDGQTDIISMSLADAYKTLMQLFTQKPELRKRFYDEARFGKGSFDIYTVIEGHHIINTKKGMVKIEGKTMPQREFYTELEERETKIKEILIKYTDTKGISEGRC